MSNIDLIIEERPRQIGNFLVGRLLPFRKKRMVGPFAFLDHMGPVQMGEDENFDIAPHPHIGLSTLTYLFKGVVVHRDSLGTNIEIKPGQVNWMTAGKGIAHSERTPDRLRGRKKEFHGFQIWVALPKHLEEIEPSFHHADVEDLPTWSEKGVEFKLIAGEVMGQKSPIPVYSPLYFIEIKTEAAAEIDLSNKLFGEKALYLLEGSLECEGTQFQTKQLLVSVADDLCSFKMGANSTVYVFGGEPFEEERLIEWNYVATSQELIDKAKEKWRNHEFPKVPGDGGYIPQPE